MEGPPPAAGLEELLAHRAWVRRVARALVLDESRADDLEQDVWLRALQSPPSRPSRGWLGTVLRNAACNMRRGEGRRRVHEAVVHAARSLPSPEEFLQRTEVVERVARAVRTLAEPYRTAIFLRYFEDLSPPAIAEQLGVPPETVRTRLRRALAILRERLDAEDRGDRRKWMLLLLPFSRMPGPGAAGPAVSCVPGGVLGAVLMTLKAKAAMVAVGVLLCLGAAWWNWPSAPETKSTSTGRPAPSRPGTAMTAGVEAQPRIPAGPILVLDPDGKPVAGASIGFLPGTGWQGTAEVLPLGKTGADGRFRWPEKGVRFPGLLRAEHPDFAPGDASVTTAAEKVVLHLGRSLVLQGVVLRRKDRAPIAGVELLLRYDRLAGPLGPILGTSGSFTVRAKSGSDGTFTFRGLSPPSQCLIEARVEGCAPVQQTWYAPRDGLPIVVEMDPAAKAVVRLKDPSGRPLPDGAVVLCMGRRRIRWSEEGSTTDLVSLHPEGDGSYTAEDLPPDWYLAVGAHPGFRPSAGIWVAVREGAGPAEITLEPAVGLRGRVIDAETKAPVAAAKVRAVVLQMNERLENSWPRLSLNIAASLGGAVEVVTGADGAFHLPCAGPGEDSVLVVLAEGYESWSGYAFVKRIRDLGEGPPFVVELMPVHPMAVRGRVVGEDGKAVRGAVVRWGSGSTTTGADGVFSIAGMTANDYATVMAPGCFPVSLGTRSASAPNGDYGDVVLIRSRTIWGRVVDGDGRPVPGVNLGVGAVPAPELPSTVIRPMVATSDGGGGISFEGLPTSDHRVSPWTTSGWAGEVRVPAGATEPFILRVTRVVANATATATVRGRVEMPDGGPPPFMTRVSAWLQGEDHPVSGVAAGSVDPDGAFVLKGLPAGTYRLAMWGTEEWRGAVEDVHVAEGTDLEVVLRCVPVPPEERPKPSPLTDIVLRPVPARTPKEMRVLMGWVTNAKASRSALLRPEDEGLRARVRKGEGLAAWVFEVEARVAGIARTLDPDSAGHPTVDLAPAGSALLMPRKDGRERWVEVRDASGTPVYSNLETSLPGVAGRGYLLVLPEGSYEVVLSLGITRKEPVSLRVEVRRGETTEVPAQ